jgi:hypothetical protein
MPVLTLPDTVRSLSQEIRGKQSNGKENKLSTGHCQQIYEAVQNAGELVAPAFGIPPEKVWITIGGRDLSPTGSFIATSITWHKGEFTVARGVYASRTRNPAFILHLPRHTPSSIISSLRRDGAKRPRGGARSQDPSEVALMISYNRVMKQIQSVRG